MYYWSFQPPLFFVVVQRSTGKCLIICFSVICNLNLFSGVLKVSSFLSSKNNSDNIALFITYYILSFQTKLESERILASVGKKPPQEIGIKVKNHSGGGVSLTHNKNFRKLLKEIIGDTAPRLTELNTKEFAGFQVGLLNKVNCDINSLLGVVGRNKVGLVLG